IVTVGGTARFMRDDGYPGRQADEVDAAVDGLAGAWGKPLYAQGLAPSMSNDAEACEKVARWLRHALSPGMARRVFDMALRLDVRSLLPSVTCPVLLLSSSRSLLVADPAQRDYLVATLPNARGEIFDTRDHIPYQRDHFEWMYGHIQEFVTGQQPAPEIEDRVLATVLFADVVSSTET